MAGESDSEQAAPIVGARDAIVCSSDFDPAPAGAAIQPAVNRRQLAALAGAAALLAVQIGPWWYSSIDSASYLSMARNLARGVGPLNLGSRLWWYSPGYPALISPLFLSSERPFLGLMIVQWLLAVGLMLGIFCWMRRAAPSAAVWIACLSVINHGLWLHFRRPLSELAFMCALVWAVVLLNKLRWQSPRPSWARQLAGAGALAALACAIRPVGIMLAPAFVASMIFHRPTWRRAIAAALVVGAATTVPVTLFVVHERLIAAELDGRTYLDEFREAAQAPLASWSAGLQMCISDAGRVCIPGLFKSHGTPGDWADPNMLVHLPFLALVCYGWRRWMAAANDIYAWFMPFYFLLIVAHAIDTGARLLLPLLPALLACVWFALEGMKRGRALVLGACLALQLGVGAGYWLIYDLPRARECHRYWDEIDRLASKFQSDRDARISADLPSELHLMLEVALDRPVLRRHGPQTPDADWYVSLDERSQLRAEKPPARNSSHQARKSPAIDSPAG